MWDMPIRATQGREWLDIHACGALMDFAGLDTVDTDGVEKRVGGVRGRSAVTSAIRPESEGICPCGPVTAGGASRVTAVGITNGSGPEYSDR